MGRMVMKPETGAATAPSTAVIEAIAEHEGLDPLDLEHPLYEVIDPDALDDLIRNNQSRQAPPEITIEFSYNGCRVHVSGDGSVEVSSQPG